MIFKSKKPLEKIRTKLHKIGNEFKKIGEKEDIRIANLKVKLKKLGYEKDPLPFDSYGQNIKDKRVASLLDSNRKETDKFLKKSNSLARAFDTELKKLDALKKEKNLSW